MTEKLRESKEPRVAVEYIIDSAQNFSKARAERVYLEEFRKSLKAILMKQSRESAISAQERDAYANPQYQELLKGIKEAVEAEEKLRWEMIAAQALVEIWRTEQATARAQDRLTY